MNNHSSQVYVIDECPDLMVDAYVFDASFNMLFLSLWGRDTAIQSFIACLTLSQDEQGLKVIHLINAVGGELPVHFASVDTLKKKLARIQRKTLFGALTHLWLYDTRLIQPDITNAHAYLLLPQNSSEEHQHERIWQMIKSNSSLPLLDHWKSTVINLLERTQMLTVLPQSGMGQLTGYELKIETDQLAQLIGAEIKNNVLVA